MEDSRILFFMDRNSLSSSLLHAVCFSVCVSAASIHLKKIKRSRQVRCRFRIALAMSNYKNAFDKMDYVSAFTNSVDYNGA